MPKKKVIKIRDVYETNPDGVYAQATRVGNLIYTTGITPRDPSGEIVGKGDVRVQSKQVLENIKRLLRYKAENDRAFLRSYRLLQEMQTNEARREPEQAPSLAKPRPVTKRTQSPPPFIPPESKCAIPFQPQAFAAAAAAGGAPTPTRPGRALAGVRAGGSSSGWPGLPT